MGVAIGTAKYIALVGLLGIDGKTKFYATQEEEDEVVQVLKDFKKAISCYEKSIQINPN